MSKYTERNVIIHHCPRCGVDLLKSDRVCSFCELPRPVQPRQRQEENWALAEWQKRLREKRGK